MRTARRVGAVVLLCVGIALGIVSPSSAATTPPYPETGGAATSWECVNTAPDATAPPTGQACSVTGWAADPSPAPVTMAPGEPISGTVSIDGAQWAGLIFGLGVLVMIAVASFVIGQSRPPTFGMRLHGRGQA